MDTPVMRPEIIVERCEKHLADVQAAVEKLQREVDMLRQKVDVLRGSLQEARRMIEAS